MKKKILFIIVAAIIIIGSVTTAMIITNHKKEEKQEGPTNVVKIDKITPLTVSNSSDAATLIKENTVKIINQVDDETSIVGTGFFHESGYLVTNSHIVDIEGKLSVVFSDNIKATAKVYSNDIISDIALLSVENAKVKAMHFGNTLSLNITDDVYAIGYPYALDGESSVSKGILSARRSAGGIEFLQSDVSLNTGNSGGPLINDKGELLGINTYATPNASLGMAISAESLENLITKLINNNEVHYLESDRPSNALNVVLTEIGHQTDDIYGQKDIIKHHFHPEHNDDISKPDDKHNDNQSSMPSKPSRPITTFKDLKIENYDDFDFKKGGGGPKYIELRNNETELNITIIPNDSRAIPMIEGNSNFKPGLNVVWLHLLDGYDSRNTVELRVIKPISDFSNISVNVGASVQYCQNKNANCLHASANFQDRDGLLIYTDEYAILDSRVFNTSTINVYAGQKGNGNASESVRLLKSYTLTVNDIKKRSYDMDLQEIRSLLNDDDYKEQDNTYANITVEFIINTKQYGTKTYITHTGIKK